MRQMSKNNESLIEFLNSQKESGKYESFVWAEALGVFVVSAYFEKFEFHFNKWNESHGVVWEFQKLPGSRFMIFM
jgi:hypothetical protein